jgi:AraC-like DNA-binding protein
MPPDPVSVTLVAPTSLTTEYFRGARPHTPGIELLTCWRMCLRSWRHKNLQTPYWRIYRNNDNHGIIFHNDRTIPLRSGLVYLIAPETPYGSDLNGDCDHLFLHFLAPSPFDLCRNYIHVLAETPAITQAIDLITAEQLDSPSRISPLAGMAALSLIASALITLPPERLASPRPDPRLLPVVKTILAAPEKNHTNGALAALAGMSVNTFIRRFSRGYNLPPQQYILAERLRKACFLLQYSTLSIEEIAEQTGFCDRFYFTRMFSRFRHISPAEFRQTGPGKQLRVKS